MNKRKIHDGELLMIMVCVCVFCSGQGHADGAGGRAHEPD